MRICLQQASRAPHFALHHSASLVVLWNIASRRLFSHPHPHPPRRYDLWTRRITRVRDGTTGMDFFASCDSLSNPDQSALDGVLSLAILNGIYKLKKLDKCFSLFNWTH